MAQQQYWCLVTSRDIDFGGGGEMCVHYCGMDQDAASRVADAAKRRYEARRYVGVHPLGTDDRGGGRHHPSDFLSIQGFNLDHGLDEGYLVCERDQ